MLEFWMGRRTGAPARCRAAFFALLTLMASAAPAQAVGDLLVAPTRVIFERATRTADVTLTNIGDAPATYRISLEFRRMTAAGQLIDVTEPSELEKLTQSMIRYAPRKIQLEPGQPQQIRLSLRKPETLADGEYRVHMLFRAVPEDGVEALSPQAAQTTGIAIQLRPIYGITIPVFVRHGAIDSKASITGASQQMVDGKPVLAVELHRDGQKSVYGSIRIIQAGAKLPVGLVRGVAVYPEVTSRSVLVPVDAKTKGRVTVQYVIGGETDAERVAAEFQTVLN